MQTVSEFFLSIIPCWENGIDSIGGGVYLFFAFLLLVSTFRRPINRQALYRRWTGVYWTEEDHIKEVDKLIKERTPYKRRIIWSGIWLGLLRYSCGLFGIFGLMHMVKWQTAVYHFIVGIIYALTIPMAVHRLYSHKAFKASRAYEIVMMLLNTLLMQNSMIHWARDHRCHHKFVDTDADPHNAKRGLFFSQIGWFLVERHPDVLRKGRKVDMSDLTSNPVLAFQRRYYAFLVCLCYGIVVAIPQLCWGERFWVAIFRCVHVPWMIVFTLTGMINSWAHYAGTRPYNKKITASDGSWMRNLVTLGEGYHNFHHAFPHDYRSATSLGPTTLGANLVYLCSKVGLTSDLKTVSDETIERFKVKSSEMGIDNLEY